MNLELKRSGYDGAITADHTSLLELLEHFMFSKEEEEEGTEDWSDLSCVKKWSSKVTCVDYGFRQPLWPPLLTSHKISPFLLNSLFCDGLFSESCREMNSYYTLTLKEINFTFS